jgi:Na+/proline symporter
MKLLFVDWLIIFSVPVFALAASYIYRKKYPGSMSRRGFGLANQQLGGSAVASTYIGANVTFTSIFIILSQEGYKRGYWVLCIPIFWFLGTLLFIWFYPRIKDYIINGITLHQAIGQTFRSSSIKFYASIWTIIAFVLTVGLEFYGGIKLISATNVPFLSYILIAIIFIVIVGYFTSIGGFGGVAYADVILDLFTFGGLIVLSFSLLSFAFSIFTNNGVQSSFNEKIPPIPSLGENVIFTMSMMILFLPFQFCTFDSWQRLSARKNRASSPTLLLLISGFFVSVCFCIPIFIGIYLRSTGKFVDIENNQLVLFEFLINQAYQPFWIGVIFAGFIAAIFSTADELLNCCSYSFLSDALEVDGEDKQALNYSYKFYVVVFCIISAIAAISGLWKGKEITDLGLAVFSTQIVFILPLIFVFLNIKTANRYVTSVKFSMIAAFIASILFVIIGWAIQDKTFIEGAPIGALATEVFIFLLLSLFAKNRP